MSTEPSEAELGPIKECIYRGEKIQAIKGYREATGVGLAEAKEAVERLEAALRASSPERFGAGRKAKGCLGVLIALGGVATLGLLFARILC